MDRSPALAALSALAHETRLAIIRLLISRGDGGMCAGGIAAHVQVSASRLSFHLKLLEQAGLVSAHRDGRHIFYRADRPRMGALIGYLLNDCCAADPEVRACCGAGRLDGQSALTSGTLKI